MAAQHPREGTGACPGHRGCLTRREWRRYLRCDHTPHSRLLRRGARVADPDRRRERSAGPTVTHHVPGAGERMGAWPRARTVGSTRLRAEGLDERADPRSLLRRHDPWRGRRSVRGARAAAARGRRRCDRHVRAEPVVDRGHPRRLHRVRAPSRSPTAPIRCSPVPGAPVRGLQLRRRRPSTSAPIRPL